MHSLHLYQTESVDKLAWPVVTHAITLKSSAMTIFTDFKQHVPHVVDVDTPAIELERLMKKSHIKMQLVLNAKGQFVGIVSLNDLTEQAIMQKTTQLGLAREELRAGDFLRSKTSLQSFDYDELTRSCVGDVVETLKDNGQQHCLVLDRDAHEVRGVISVSDVARTLKLPLDIQAQPSFSSLSKVIAA